MAFVHQPLGALVATNPTEAHAQLANLFMTHRTREAVGKAIGVDARTLARWITKLKATPHGDPRAKKTAPDPERKKIAKKPRQKAKPGKARKKVVAR